MVVTEDLTIFGPLLGGRAQVGGVAIADAEETAAVTSRLGNASAATAAREVDAVAGSSNAARREAMREGGIPTSQQPRSQVRSPHGNSYEYNVNRQNNRSSDKRSKANECYEPTPTVLGSWSSKVTGTTRSNRALSYAEQRQGSSRLLGSEKMTNKRLEIATSEPRETSATGIHSGVGLHIRPARRLHKNSWSRSYRSALAESRIKSSSLQQR
jgi:hypothetical protein